MINEHIIEYSMARREHLAGILALNKQLAPGEEPVDINEAEKIWEKAERQGIRYFVATDGAEVAASLYIAIIPNLTRGGKSNGFIENVVTGEKYRRKGIGKTLIKMAVEHAEANNCYKVVLLSSVKRKEAHLFYKECGFDGDSKRGFEIRFQDNHHGVIS
jgi:GNAT superfamily N-acetyltransferase